MTRFDVALLVGLSVFSSIDAEAMTFVPMSVADLTRSSTVTVVGTVDSVNGSKSADGRIFTLAGDSDSTNNATKLVIDVVDKNDF